MNQFNDALFEVAARRDGSTLFAAAGHIFASLRSLISLIFIGTFSSNLSSAF